MSLLLNDLPKYSSSVRDIIEFQKEKKFIKNKEQVIREYNAEKWANIKKMLLSKERQYDVYDIDRIFENDSNGAEPVWHDGKLICVTPMEALKFHEDIYRSTLAEYISESSALCELGAGYGRFILRLSKYAEFADKGLYAYDLTNNGKECMDLIAKNMNIELNTGLCDIYEKTMRSSAPQENSLIFTSYSMHYKPNHKPSIFNLFRELKPSIVVNFEPIFEHMPQDSVYGLLCRKYLQHNSYTENYLTLLKAEEQKKNVSILKEEKMVTSLFPFLPVSIVAWKFN